MHFLRAWLKICDFEYGNNHNKNERDVMFYLEHPVKYTKGQKGNQIHEKAFMCLKIRAIC